MANTANIGEQESSAWTGKPVISFCLTIITKRVIEIISIGLDEKCTVKTETQNVLM